MKVIIGIDPGLDNTGYGVIESRSGKFRVIETGVIRTDRKRPLEKRLRRIYANITDLIRETSPDVMIIEELYSHYKHPITSILMGHARGAVCLAAANCDLEIIGYSATRIKKAIVGKGHATKAQVQGMVRTLLELGDVNIPADASDALAMALSYFYIEERAL